MIPDGAAPFIDVLRRYHADATPHSGRTLIDHLLGTYQLLEAWGNPPDICRAGLFHSIYGTNIFAVPSASFDDRPLIRKAIGAPAERLAYLFCVTDRPLAFLQAAAERSDTLTNIVHGGAIPIEPHEVKSLIEIEVANFIEQPENLDDLRLIRDTIVSITQSGPLLSALALMALTEMTAKSPTT